AAIGRAGSTKMLGQALGEIERRRPPDVILEVALHLAAEARIVLRLGVSLLQLENERHQRLGDEAAAVEPEMPALVGPGAERVELLDGHARLMALSGAARVLAPWRAAARSARSAIGSAFITGRPKRSRTIATRSGVSLP